MSVFGWLYIFELRASIGIADSILIVDTRGGITFTGGETEIPGAEPLTWDEH